MPGPVSVTWNLRRYGFVGSARWMARAASYRSWMWLTPQGRREAHFDKINGTDTEGYISQRELALPPGSIEYAPIRPRTFFSILNKLDIDRGAFTFIDVGCGKGRALLLAHSMGFKSIVGVEYSARLAAIAVKNSERIGAQIQTMDAAQFSFPVEDSIVFLFNPFWSPTIDIFANNLASSLSEHPRKLYVVYVNPFCERAFQRQSCLAPVSRIANYYAIYRSIGLV
jgi:SAM-dependent methyltransferase